MPSWTGAADSVNIVLLLVLSNACVPCCGCLLLASWCHHGPIAVANGRDTQMHGRDTTAERRCLGTRILIGVGVVTAAVLRLRRSKAAGIGFMSAAVGEGAIGDLDIAEISPVKLGRRLATASALQIDIIAVLEVVSHTSSILVKGVICGSMPTEGGCQSGFQ
jgi:hypothetical protein